MNTKDDQGENGFLYLYCIAEAMPLFRPEIAAGNIEVIQSNGIYGVAGRVSAVEFSEENLKKNLSDMKWVEAMVLQHQKIVQEAMATCTVIPCKFATIFKTEEKIQALFDKHNKAFEKTLEFLEGKEEWGVKVFCNPERLRATLEEAVEIKKIEGEMSLSSAGKNYFLRKKKDNLTEALINKKIHEYGLDCFETLTQQSRDVRVNKPLPQQAAGRREDLVLNVAFLVEKTKLKGFFDSIDYLKESYHPKGFDLDCTGPWPPYNFSSIMKEIVL